MSEVTVSGHLTVVSGIGDAASNIAFYHGVTLTDFDLDVKEKLIETC